MSSSLLHQCLSKPMPQQTKSRGTGTVLSPITPDFHVSLHITVPVQPSCEPTCPAVFLFVLPDLESALYRVFSASLSSSQQNGAELTAACAGSGETEWGKSFGEASHTLGLQVWKESAPKPHSLGCSLPLASYRGMGVWPWPSEARSHSTKRKFELTKKQIKVCKKLGNLGNLHKYWFVSKINKFASPRNNTFIAKHASHMGSEHTLCTCNTSELTIIFNKKGCSTAYVSLLSCLFYSYS